MRQHEVSLTEDEIKLVKWALQVAISAVSVQSGDKIDEEEAFITVAELDRIDNKLLEYLEEANPDNLFNEQLTLFDP